MPVNLNKNTKKESGILLSGKEAKKVFSMFQNEREHEYVEKKKASLQSLFNTAIKISTLQ
jgi:hypothetical protein